MMKINQTIICKDNGNCMQAVVASLFELGLEDVPHFLEFENQWFIEFRKFFKRRGYDPTFMWKGKRDLKEVAYFDGGINGYFYATVPSQTYKDVGHAVVVDKDLNIVHDPNPNKLAEKNCTLEDIEELLTVGHWYINENGKFIRGDYNESRDS